jgi:hypothetical protein
MTCSNSPPANKADSNSLVDLARFHVVNRGQVPPFRPWTAPQDLTSQLERVSAILREALDLIDDIEDDFDFCFEQDEEALLAPRNSGTPMTGKSSTQGPAAQ